MSEVSKRTTHRSISNNLQRATFFQKKKNIAIIWAYRGLHARYTRSIRHRKIIWFDREVRKRERKIIFESKSINLCCNQLLLMQITVPTIMLMKRYCLRDVCMQSNNLYLITYHTSFHIYSLIAFHARAGTFWNHFQWQVLNINEQF